jgi:hypothetical protein
MAWERQANAKDATDAKVRYGIRGEPFASSASVAFAFRSERTFHPRWVGEAGGRLVWDGLSAQCHLLFRTWSGWCFAGKCFPELQTSLGKERGLERLGSLDLAM